MGESFGYPNARYLRTRQERAKVVLGHSDVKLRQMIAAALEADGHRVFSVEDGAAMLDWLADALLDEADTGIPDVIIAESELPGRHGFALVADLRAVGWDLPFILLAKPGQQIHWPPGPLYSVFLFQEPFDMDDLRTAVAMMLNSSRAEIYGQQILERREMQRVPANLWAEEFTGTQIYRVRIEDLSVGGALVRHMLPRRPGTTLNLRVPLRTANVTCDVRATVVNSRPLESNCGLGVRFVEMADHTRHWIQHFVNRELETADLDPTAPRQSPRSTP